MQKKKKNCKTISRCCAALSGCLSNLNLSQTPLINLEGLYVLFLLSFIFVSISMWRVPAAHELHKWFNLCPQASFPQRPLSPLLVDNVEPLQLPALLFVAPRLLPSLTHEAHQVIECFFLNLVLEVLGNRDLGWVSNNQNHVLQTKSQSIYISINICNIHEKVATFLYFDLIK